MPRGFTDSIKKAKDSFEELKQESLIKGKNLATRNNIAKQSGTSRNNFYTLKNKEWKNFVDDIDIFEKKFLTLAQGRYKNPEVEIFKKKARDYEVKYTAMAQQNHEFLENINYLERVILDKEQTINLLKERLNSITIQEDIL